MDDCDYLLWLPRCRCRVSDLRCDLSGLVTTNVTPSLARMIHLYMVLVSCDLSMTCLWPACDLSVTCLWPGRPVFDSGDLCVTRVTFLWPRVAYLWPGWPVGCRRIDLELDTSSSVFEGSECSSQPAAAADRERSVLYYNLLYCIMYWYIVLWTTQLQAATDRDRSVQGRAHQTPWIHGHM